MSSRVKKKKEVKEEKKYSFDMFTCLGVVNNLDTQHPHRINSTTKVWCANAPQDYLGVFHRNDYAILSVQVGWEKSTIAYELLRELGFTTDLAAIEAVLARMGFGFRDRAVALQRHRQKFWEHPEAYLKHPHETWEMCRARIQAFTSGLGEAKSAFALEMTYPLICETVCLDRHMCRIFGWDHKKKMPEHLRLSMVDRWVNPCKTLGIPPAIARNLQYDLTAPGDGWASDNPNGWFRVFNPEREIAYRKADIINGTCFPEIAYTPIIRDDAALYAQFAEFIRL